MTAAWATMAAEVPVPVAVVASAALLLGVLVVERIAAGVRAVEARAERDAARAEADRLRVALVDVARDVARMREAHAQYVARVAPLAAQSHAAPMAAQNAIHDAARADAAFLSAAKGAESRVNASFGC